MKRTPIRQGDVLLVPVDEIPADAKAQKRDGGRLIVAYGEVTGHAHQIVKPGYIHERHRDRDLPTEEDAVKLTTAEGATFLRLAKKAQLVHEEHATIDLAAGAYKYVAQVEHTAWGVRQVMD